MNQARGARREAPGPDTTHRDSAGRRAAHEAMHRATTPAPPPTPPVPTITDLLTQLAYLHEAKGSDYDGAERYSNLRRARALGISPFRATLVRMSDKWERLVQLSQSIEPPKVSDETIADTLLDLALYALIARILHAEEDTSPPAAHAPQTSVLVHHDDD